MMDETNQAGPDAPVVMADATKSAAPAPKDTGPVFLEVPDVKPNPVEQKPFYTSVTGPRWANEAKTLIDCVVAFSAFPDPLPFTATADDEHDHCKEIFDACVAGDYGPIADYVAPAVVVSAETPVQKLAAFLAANPDVVAHIEANPPAS